jgi:mRNA-degrading endonuclease RelE of RelBE toxin-antitoxin system
MVRGVKFELVFAPEVLDHLDVIEKKYHRLLRQAIRDQLTFQPGNVTRNRKPLEQPAPFQATWELRCGPNNRFRVFYDIDPSSAVVEVLGIGVKDRNVLHFGRQEYDS